MKNERGITMIALVLVIILMLILTTTGVFTGIDAYKTMKTQTFIAQMKVVREKVNVVRDEYKSWDKYTGVNINEYIEEKYTMVDNGIIIYAPKKLSTYNSLIATEFLDIIRTETTISSVEDTTMENYYYFPAEDLETAFGLTNLDVNVIINFNTGTIVEQDGVEATTIFGRTTRFYVLEELLDMQSANFNPSTGGSSGALTNEELKITEVSLVENSASNTRVKLKLNKLYENLIQEVRMKSALDSSVDIKISTSIDVTNTIIEFDVPQTYIGTYIFEVTDNTGTTIQSPTVEIVKVNAPVTIGTGITKVKWDTGYIEAEATTDVEWYDYSTRNKKWANIKMEDGSYYVWIPRFAYYISDGKIDVKFINGNGTTTFEGTTIGDEYKIPSAFTKSSTTYDYGEFDRELTGIWVSKYECIIEEQESAEPKYLFKSLPFRSLLDNVGLDFYNVAYYAREIERYLDVYGFSNIDYLQADGTTNRGSYTTGLILNNDTLINVDTHLIKNSEWAALSYLTYSVYGSNGQPASSSSKYTGDAKEQFTPSIEGVFPSSTGTVYGVFDLTNNKEFVAAGAKSVLPANSNIGVSSSNKYITMYADSEVNNNILYCDAMKELENRGITSGTSNVYLNVDEGKNFFTRGGSDIFTYIAVTSSDTTENGNIGIRLVWTFEENP